MKKQLSLAAIVLLGCREGQVKIGNEDTGFDTGDSVPRLESYICTSTDGTLDAVRTREASPDENYYGQEVHIGSSADGVEAALVQCNTDAISGYQITQATLSFDAAITRRSSYDGAEADIALNAYQILVPWQPKTVTYNVLDAYEEPFGERLADINVFVEEGTERFSMDITNAFTAETYGVSLMPLIKESYDPTSYENQADSIASNFTIEFVVE
ncbi:DNRLRE domain-containing protein [Candidatus Woesearchaeota archaeon]|nr:DNRLRE domain-containing protein [Candidatus Woesearchaeota archaeon]